MSRPKKNSVPDNVVHFAPTGMYHGYGRFSWPSENDPKVNYATRVDENRTTTGSAREKLNLCALES